MNQTEKGFTITQIDGAYYIDGTLIVNKTYPLPEGYSQDGLTAEAANAFSEMRRAARIEGLNIFIDSGFRSHEYQAQLYKDYCEADGKEEADRYSARPGHSEHETGLAIDVNDQTEDFAYTDEGTWLKHFCAFYGFIIRYPKDKEDITGYIYEPWHIRYVGKSLAKKLYLGNGKFTTMEEYFGITSKYNY